MNIMRSLYVWICASNMTYNEQFRLACKKGYLVIVQQLYKRKWDLCNDTDAFLLACENGHLDVVRQLHEWNPAIVVGADGENGFIWSCCYGHLAIAQQLLKWNVDINISANGEAAFLLACKHGHLNIAQWFHSLHPEKYQIQIQDEILTSWYVIAVPLVFTGSVTMASQECPICYDVQSTVLTSCGHQFCQSCILHLENRNNCPYCRAKEITFRQIAS